MNRVSIPTKKSLRDANPDFVDALDSIEANMGFLPQNILMMTHWPEFASAFLGMVRATETTRTISEELQDLVWVAANAAASCRYCQAHMAARASHAGIPQEKIDAIPEYQTSPLFTDAERAAIDVAYHGAMLATTEAQFEELRKHYSEREIVEIVAYTTIAGFLNRWNDGMASTLEPQAMNYAMKNLAKNGWDVGKHEGEMAALE